MSVLGGDDDHQSSAWVSLQDKKAMLSFTTGGSQSMFQPDGVNGDINVLLWPLQVASRKLRPRRPDAAGLRMAANRFRYGFFQNGTLHFCGFQVLAPQIFWSPAHAPPQQRTAMLDGWRARLKGLMAERPLAFAPAHLFNLSFEGGFTMKPEMKKLLERESFGLTTGHHLGKPLPPDNQLKAPDDWDNEQVVGSCFHASFHEQTNN